ncbi:hypothetical protein DWB61_13580 [Ancylomarina euxinus]|uniref:DUF5673 domain-containing protein n=1 Tax=Ancylomarina euxinus TaxID=2283627 RepID=A0A425XYS2_9BACT|nr:hypothetical protein [Ancylomarina euxinus]MCZ4695753.1 hypothetical protein [Ancylomarina euxinus]MUP16206.1 hypothetical protein [Ancylomarina euxinus]RRG20066.1 hypothetical protein DWB61_13580 [Ancylomarina euxinus]
MEKIQLYKVKKVNVRFFMWFSLFFVIFGLVDLINASINGFNSKFPGGDWLSVIYILQGITFALMGYQQMKRGQYFIECDDKEFKYLIPKSKTVKCLAIADMEELIMDGIDIRFQVKEIEHHIRLEHIEWKELNSVKELIWDLSLRLSQNNA